MGLAEEQQRSYVLQALRETVDEEDDVSSRIVFRVSVHPHGCTRKPLQEFEPLIKGTDATVAVFVGQG